MRIIYKKELFNEDEERFDIIKEFKGDYIVGLSYEPLFDYLTKLKEVKVSKNCFTILHGDFVTLDDGTGIVHTAPGFGEDDNIVCKSMGIPTICPVDDAGCFTDIVYDFAGQQVFDANDPIIIKLKQGDKWFKTEQYVHNYPHCWRTDTPLIYRAMSSWYVDVPKIRERMIKNNQNINWIPEHVKNGRFGKWLEGAREWSITRNRFWGCPIPVWKSTDPKYPRIDVYGSLDEIERELNSDVLCIKDGEEIVALAGIMGGLNSGVKDDTTEIVFESANFDGTNIRVNSKNLGLRTESSSRFEKDIDPNLAALALDRACALVEELGCGEIMEGTIDVYNNVKEEKTLEVSVNWINKFLGTSLEAEEMKRCLDSLDLKTTINGDTLEILVPTFRIDVDIREDVAEEVARIYGYNNIPATLISTSTEKEAKDKKQLLDEKVIDTMLASGLNQSISYSFVSPKVFDKICVPEDSSLRNVVKIKNPLGEDYSVMRTSTLPSMMESLARNYSRSNEIVRLFEIGKTYIPNSDENELPTERNILTIGIYGQCDYFDLKGIVENLLDSLGLKSASFKRMSENPSYHPGKTAELILGRTSLGVLGEIHPDVNENYGVDVPCYVAELDLDAMYNFSKTEKAYKPLPKYPAITRDIALLVDDAVLVQEIEDAIRKAGGQVVEKVELFDVYKGAQIPEGKKSIAYAIAYRDPSKTLKDKDINKVHDKILRALEYKLGAQLREQ